MINRHPVNQSDSVKSPGRLPLIGDSAPAFDAETTQGTIHFPRDYTGKWVILFSHSSDFTPVCTSEFMAFSRLVEECRNLNTELIGLSVDSLSSHVAWIYAIQEQIKFRGLKNIHIRFPLIADLSQTIARRYGMLHPKASEAKTVRAVFFIDPDGIIRTILYYPTTTGRNFDEIMRILISLQTTDAFGVATPANWQPGDDVVLPETGKAPTESTNIKKNNAQKSAGWFQADSALTAEKIKNRLHKRKK